MLDIQYKQGFIQVASWVLEWLKNYDLEKLGNLMEISKLGGERGQCTYFLSETKH